MDYIDIVGVRYIFVQLARERRRSSYRQMGREEREARWEVVRQVLYPKLNVLLTTGDFFLTL